MSLTEIQDQESVDIVMEYLHSSVNLVRDLGENRKHSRWISWLLIAVDTVLTGVIIKAVPYTEIDWVAYMQQIAIYRSGERDYANIKGQTGPLVYPAGHVVIYDWLYRATEKGTDIFMAQCIFAVLYLATLGVVMACYRRAGAPPYLLPLLILSKRLHSIFVLRLFNDCFAVFGLFSAIYFYQINMYTLGGFMFSLAVSVKMSILLAAPGIGMVLLQALPTKRAVSAVFLMAQIQFLLGIPFITVDWRSYVSRAFQFTRQFLYQWTVNWRFVGEEIFLSSGFSMALLALHLSLLILYASTRWTKPSGLSLVKLAKTVFKPLPESLQGQISRNVTPDFVMTTTLSSLMIGLLCARSLHYQFYSYIAWSTPYLLWKAKLPPYLIVAVWAAQEVAWNIYPSTDTSSITVVGCLLVQVFGLWCGKCSTDNEIETSQKARPRRNE